MSLSSLTRRLGPIPTLPALLDALSHLHALDLLTDAEVPFRLEDELLHTILPTSCSAAGPLVLVPLEHLPQLLDHCCPHCAERILPGYLEHYSLERAALVARIEEAVALTQEHAALAELESLLPACSPEVLLASRHGLERIVFAVTGSDERDADDPGFRGWEGLASRARALASLVETRLHAPETRELVLDRLRTAELARLGVVGVAELDETPTLLASPQPLTQLRDAVSGEGATLLADLLDATSLRAIPAVLAAPRFATDMLLRSSGAAGLAGLQAATITHSHLAPLAAALYDPRCRGPLASLAACLSVASELEATPTP